MKKCEEKIIATYDDGKAFLTIHQTTNPEKEKNIGGLTIEHRIFILGFVFETKKDVKMLISGLKKLIE